jgi:hypothetical protein
MLFSCTSDDLENNSTNPVINQLKNDLKLDQFSNKNISQNLVVNWETPSRIEKDGFEIYEIGITETNEVKISSKIFQESLKYELIAIKKDSTVYSYFIEAFSSVHNDLYTGTIQELDNYTGTLNVFDLGGKQLGQLLVHNGVAKNPSNSAELEHLELAINLFSRSNKKGLTRKLPECNNTYTVKLLNDQWEDRFEEWTYASTGEVFLTKYLGRVFIKTEDTYETMSVSYPCDSEYTNDDIHIPFITKNYRTFNCEIADVLEEKIDYALLDPCPKAIMDKLKNSTNADIADVLAKLGANSVYTVNMKMGSTAQGYAQTQKISENNYLITVANDSYTTSTNLFRAAVLIHEIIHAYYHSVVDDNNNPTTNLLLNNFSYLYQAYEEKKYPGGPTVAQHDQMANDYIDSMAMVLEAYYISSTPLPFTIPSHEVFTDLAWGTLQEASIFREKYKDGDPVKARILNRYRTESSGRSVEVNTTLQQNPIGKPCN